MFTVGASSSWDSNLFRLPDNADVAARTGGRSTRADRTDSLYAGFRIDQPYAQQRFRLEATETAYRHQTFKHLDFDATQYSGAWDWTLTPRLTGVLSADRSQSLVNYADFRDPTQRNVRTTDVRRASVDWWAYSGWHVLSALTQTESRSSQATVAFGSFRSDAAEAGIKYVAQSTSSVAVNLRSSSGTYLNQPPDPVNFLGDGFKRDELELVTSWLATGRTSWDARVARVAYRENLFSQRDFTDTAASLGWRWTPTGRVTFAIDLARDLIPWRDLTATHRVDKRISVGPVWQIAARTTLRATLSSGSSSYRNPLVPQPGGERHDGFYNALLGFDWTITRRLTANASVQRQVRTSTDPNFGYTDRIATVGLSLLF
jgi:exopolysaccharide biosynthesis operon protein EpsL